MSRTVKNNLYVISPQETLSCGELIMMKVKQLPVINGQVQPLQYDDLKKIQRVDDIIGEDKLTPSFKFEDADYDFIIAKVNSGGWPFYSKGFIEFSEFIKNVPIDKDSKKK